VTRPLPRGSVVVEVSICSREPESFEAVEAVTGGDVIESSRGVSQSRLPGVPTASLLAVRLAVSLSTIYPVSRQITSPKLKILRNDSMTITINVYHYGRRQGYNATCPNLTAANISRNNTRASESDSTFLS
jgi:hypothetical protein